MLVAPVPPKLIPKGKFTIQTWVKFLLDKYLAQIPVNRQRILLAQAGLPISKGLSITHKLCFSIDEDIPSGCQILEALPTAPNGSNARFAV